MSDGRLDVTVFGGSGFIGSHVSDKLTERGHKVVIFDNEKSQWLKDGQVQVIGDILDKHAVFKAVKNADVVYNFAAIADLDIASQDAAKTISINVVGTTNILEGCKLHKVKRFVLASTVYAGGVEGGLYRISKQACESLAREYHDQYDLDYTILRYGSVYGPRSDQHNGLFRVVASALRDGKIIYSGHPDAVREYIHVEDVASASVNILDEEFKNCGVVLTGHQTMKVSELLEMLAEILGSKGKVQFVDHVKDGHYIRTPYSIQPDLNYKYLPNVYVDLGQGLLQLIEYTKCQLGEK